MKEIRIDPKDFWAGMSVLSVVLIVVIWGKVDDDMAGVGATAMTYHGQSDSLYVRFWVGAQKYHMPLTIYEQMNIVGSEQDDILRVGDALGMMIWEGPASVFTTMVIDTVDASLVAP